MAAATASRKITSDANDAGRIPSESSVSAASATGEMNFAAFAKALATIVGVVVIGRYVIDFLLKFVALSKVREAMTAAALLAVVGVAIVMQQVGLSASLGSFLAGALLAESSYRHQREADIAPLLAFLSALTEGLTRE